jgi:hypothetical protein
MATHLLLVVCRRDRAHGAPRRRYVAIVDPAPKHGIGATPDRPRGRLRMADGVRSAMPRLSRTLARPEPLSRLAVGDDYVVRLSP